MKTLLARAARGIGRLLYWSRLYTVVVRLGRRRPKVLVYHACEVEPGPFIRGLDINTPPSDLTAQLDYLAANYRIVTLAELEAHPESPGCVALTFDDGYRSVFTHVLPVMRERGLTAAIYLVTDTLDDRKPVWVNELVWWMNRYPEFSRPILESELTIEPESPAADIIEAVRARYDPDFVARLLARIRDAFPAGRDQLDAEPPPYLDREEVAEMAAAGFVFGSHTRTHPNLATLPEDRQERELTAARDAVLALPGGCRSVAYPFGSYSPTTRRLCAELGFTSVMEVGGTNAPLRLDRVARVPVSGGGAAELFVQMEIVTPLKAMIRRWLPKAQKAQEGSP